MATTAQGAYLESKVLAADPIELIRILYRAAIEAVRRAQAHLAAGRIAERSREITRAFEILVELSRSLDHTSGGDFSQRLGRLYDYLQRRLLEANMQQAAPPLVEVEGLLQTLLLGWNSVHLQGDADTPALAPTIDQRDNAKPSAGSPYPGGLPPAIDPVEYTAQSWSF